jgi:hypothetical protein
VTHKCLSCSGQITEGQGEKRTPGKGKTCRYRHANYEDCQAELSRPSEMRHALRSDRIRQRGGVVSKLPGLGKMEDWE